MPTIEFRTYNKDSFEMFRPVAAKSMQPEWWKKSKIRVDHRGRVAQTIRSCPAMQDWLTMGYYIVASVDSQMTIMAEARDKLQELDLMEDKDLPQTAADIING